MKLQPTQRGLCPKQVVAKDTVVLSIFCAPPEANTKFFVGWNFKKRWPFCIRKWRPQIVLDHVFYYRSLCEIFSPRKTHPWLVAPRRWIKWNHGKTSSWNSSSRAAACVPPIAVKNVTDGHHQHSRRCHCGSGTIPEIMLEMVPCNINLLNVSCWHRNQVALWEWGHSKVQVDWRSPMLRSPSAMFKQLVDATSSTIISQMTPKNNPYKMKLDIVKWMLETTI